MDWGCQFFTPETIAKDLADNLSNSDVVIDLYAGSGRLHMPIVELGDNSIDILAIDIDPDVSERAPNKQITYITADCLDPKSVTNLIEPFLKNSTTFVLNPPFKYLSGVAEALYWEKISNQPVRKYTYRVECIALAAALAAAPIGSKIYAIIPETLIRSERLSFFFDTLRQSCEMDILSVFKRGRFGNAEVDVVIISLVKRPGVCFVTELNNRKITSKNLAKNYPFDVFRGKVLPEAQRVAQVSAKDLKTGGRKLAGISCNNLPEAGRLVTKGDILVARVGARMLGRVAEVVKGGFTINESVLCIRASDKNTRTKLYNLLKSHYFLDWIDVEARGTSNRFIPTNTLKNWLLENIA